MTHEDRQNLEFILNASPETLQAWRETLSLDELQYAYTLMSLAILEEFDKVEDTELAKSYLSTYM